MPWQYGDQIVLRHTGIHDGETKNRPGLLHGLPHYVVEDADDRLVLWMPAGSERRYVDLADRSHRVEPTPWTLDSLRIMFPGKAYAIYLFWAAASVLPSAHPLQELFGDGPKPEIAPGMFLRWYVNLEAPFVRTAVGV